MSKLGINGFGRIGRLVLRRLLEVDSSLEVWWLSTTLTSPKVLAYLLKHDSNYGPFPWSVDFTEDALIVNGKTITVYAEKEAQHIPWQAAGAEVIVECTGFYTSAEKSQAHLQAGARKVLISAPAGEMKTIVYNVNDDTLTPDDTIISVASCTTNCLAPMAKVLQDAFGITVGHHDHHPRLYRHPVAGGRAARKRSARTPGRRRKTLSRTLPACGKKPLALVDPCPER